MKTKNLVLAALCSVFIAISAWISIPTAIPFTMQTFAIYFVLFILGAKMCIVAVGVYIMLGIIGIPVFSGFTAGIGILMGNTGGYIIGFLIIPIFMMLTEKLYNKNTMLLILFSFISLIICYTLGTLWFYFLYTANTGAINITAILAMCVVPFVIPDIIKIALAYGVSKIIKPRIKND
ncbi:biotin transporter BioY [Anaerofustis sp. NSJ-163]|uniref:biotin transporter BioY n=1 Tax=Anaerofustis sp. NSJ-163 TaxID=2944391 RepID=UPI00209BE90F|nr:biotin transporter BioY [Anaerofustis sp. NSJ-163]MCO8193776.1 biotin transporter BioY [Anaerofustis sp. NSJ-163]